MVGEATEVRIKLKKKVNEGGQKTMIPNKKGHATKGFLCSPRLHIVVHHDIGPEKETVMHCRALKFIKSNKLDKTRKSDV